MLSVTHLTKDYNALELIVLAAVVVAGLLVLRSTMAPLQERVAFVSFVVVEMVIASGQFWDSTFGDGRTYVETFMLAVIMLLATPVRVTNKRLAWLAVFVIVALIAVTQRHIVSQ